MKYTILFLILLAGCTGPDGMTIDRTKDKASNTNTVYICWQPWYTPTHYRDPDSTGYWSGLTDAQADSIIAKYKK